MNWEFSICREIVWNGVGITTQKIIIPKAQKKTLQDPKTEQQEYAEAEISKAAKKQYV